MKRFLLFACALFLINGYILSSQPADTIPHKEHSDYKEALIHLLDVSGTMKTVRAIFPKLMQPLRKALPQVPEHVLDEITVKFEKRYMDCYIDLLQPIYLKYLSLEDLKELAAYYSTPIGQKLYSVQEAMSLEAVQVGQKSGAAIMKEIIGEIIQRGYDVTPL